MALFAGPFDTANMAQANWEEVESKLWSSGVINGARNSFAVTLTSGLGVSVNTGDAVVDGFRFSNDAATALTATAADPTNPRIDRVILRIDEAGHSGTIVIKAGTPAPSPTPPALTQTVGGTFEISLAQIRINAGAATIASLTDERTYATAAIGPNAITSGQIASVLASAVAAGTLPAGVILPATQLSAGAVPAGVTIPAGQVTQGNLNIGTGTLTTDNGALASDGAGNLSLTGPTGLTLRNNAGAGVHLMRMFSGTGTGTFTTGATATPTHVSLSCDATNSTQTMGFDTPGLTVHINTGSSLAWSGMAFA